MVGLMIYQYAAIVYFYFSIGRLESIKQALYELVILPLRKPELFSHEKLLGPQKGVLLYGPPGTGKTMLAKAIIRDFGAVFINMRISNLMSKWFGDARKLGHPFPQAAICTHFPRLCLGMVAISMKQSYKWKRIL